MVIRVLFTPLTTVFMMCFILIVKPTIAKNISIYDAQKQVLENIIKYSSFNNLDNINYCLYSKTPLYSLLNKEGKVKAILKNLNDDINGCNVIFIDKSYQYNISQIIFKAESKPILTIANIENFTNNNGGIMEFKIKSSKVLIKVNLQSLKKSSLVLHKDLLSVINVTNE